MEKFKEENRKVSCMLNSNIMAIKSTRIGNQAVTIEH